MTRPSTQAEVEARIEDWHRGVGPAAMPLHDALGWTWQEYARWVETGELPADCREEPKP